MADQKGLEQGIITALYGRLDLLVDRTRQALVRLQSQPTDGTPGALGEREAFLRQYSDRLKTLNAANERLCFGRLDLRDCATRYIGRIGLSDDDQQPLLTDWRAPAAEPFYQATAATPMGVVRRRHIVTSGRDVVSLEDDVLDLDSLDGQTATVQGGGALMAALAAKRTGRMRDIVATIQAEQDRIIRSPLPGVMVVEGGPGCGKTVVALHRAAYLLYTHRNRLASRGVLVVGPNAVFLRYIEQVLPALGETSALLRTPGQLVPGINATAEESDEVALLKGDLRMVRIITDAVRSRQRIPASPRVLDVGGTPITLTPDMVAASMQRARASRKPHNGARRVFVIDVLDRLAAQLADARHQDVDSRRDMLLDDLRSSRDVRREVNLAWMPLTPTHVLADLYADPDRWIRPNSNLKPGERALLRRERGMPWTVADVPLLDEIAELLGEEEEEGVVDQDSADRRRELEYAQAVLEMTGQGGVAAEHLIERYGPTTDRLSVAEQAASDRTWHFGHIVVDEAQELSPMMWRLLLRRCPSRSMTVVGDLAQTSSRAGVTSWAQVFDHLGPDAWRLERLTVNYRTPAPIMDLAAGLLAEMAPDAAPPTSAREGDDPVWVTMTGRDEHVLRQVVTDELAREPGRVCVIASRADRAWVDEVLSAAMPERVGHGAATLESTVSVMTATGAKGLEFDTVVVVDPQAIATESRRGLADLYVALTRSTGRLIVLRGASIPASLAA